MKLNADKPGAPGSPTSPAAPGSPYSYKVNYFRKLYFQLKHKINII